VGEDILQEILDPDELKAFAGNNADHIHRSTSDCNKIICVLCETVLDQGGDHNSGSGKDPRICDCLNCGRTSCLSCGAFPFHTNQTCEVHRELQEFRDKREAELQAFRINVRREAALTAGGCTNFLSDNLPPSNTQAILHSSQQIQGNNPPFTPIKERGFIRANKIELISNQDKMSLADACHRIETNEPPIKNVFITFYDGGGELWGIRPTFKWSNQEYYNVAGLRRFNQEFYNIVGWRRFNQEYYNTVGWRRSNQEYYNTVGWRRLGRAIGNNSTINHLSIDVSLFDASVQPAATCHREFYNELKHSTSIQSLRLSPVSQIVPSFDLGYFLRNNSNIEDLSLGDHMNIFSDLDASIISPAIEGAQMRRFDVGLNFGNDGVFQQISSACWGVECLEVDVMRGTNSNYSALAALLRDPRAILQRLVIKAGISANFDRRLATREIAASLVGNANLKELKLFFQSYSQTVVDEFDTLLCDASRIENIYNSNHTLEKIDIDNFDGTFHRSFPRGENDDGEMSRHNNHLSARTREYLKINENENKQKVIQNKLIQYFFVESFDVTPFAKMPFSVLARLISCGVGMSNQLHFIFRLLRNIPDFVSNVSSRSAKNLDLEC
jgi:hypothetical protein